MERKDQSLNPTEYFADLNSVSDSPKCMSFLPVMVSCWQRKTVIGILKYSVRITLVFVQNHYFLPLKFRRGIGTIQ